MSGIHGHLLEVTVVSCTKLKDTEWISRQDPYVCLEYGSTKYRTRTHKDGGKNPVFQEKFVFTLIEGLREINVVVWNSNTLTYDDFIGSGKIQLQRVLTGGYDDTNWPLQSKTGRHAGEVRLIMHYSNANKPASSYAPSASPYATSHSPNVPMHSMPPPPMTSYPPPTTSPYPGYPPNTAAYPPSSYYPPQPSAYPSPYAPPSTYPPSPYPPPPPGPYGAYPPRSY